MFSHSIKTGFSFGVTSGIITTLGLMVGLNSTTHSELVVVGGIFIIAIADAMSDALGIHMSEESENKHSPAEIWASTICTFLAKFLVAMTFVVPVLLLSLSTAILVSIIWAVFLLTLLTYFVAKGEGQGPLNAIFEHLVVAGVVVCLAEAVGRMIARIFS
ncbi:hypothetical protein COT42_01870 [Candidatus Saganbacteria bacterium CG08_land_8_20_14_0_20_45_16]|uniref:VIT family protein n=1 Tax=Candidatus Saganbacteria bacterium CG08_land_8_20_14_0_20_45_16 TaxID=2014293 RepID=A0A2H0Y0N8_UNCSA|nr:MAG: hypothetical protein COT42_01870 [Candidatus Saganbacteria bacterium CG08_land_8_20_14_0_20_45_16]